MLGSSYTVHFVRLIVRPEWSAAGELLEKTIVKKVIWSEWRSFCLIA